MNGNVNDVLTGYPTRDLFVEGREDKGDIQSDVNLSLRLSTRYLRIMKDKSIYSEAPIYFTYYFDLVESNDLLHELRSNANAIEGFLNSVSDEKWHYAYDNGKWTIAEVVRHIIETERVFAYRALCCSRFDETPLPGFNENNYISNLHSVKFSKTNMIREFSSVRESSICLFESMNTEMLKFMGNANGLQVSAEMLGFMIVGHTRHHVGIIEDRYL